MKAILLSIKPKWVAKILNGEKTIEVRKKFPENYRGRVYIYCTKNGIGYARKSKDSWFVGVNKDNPLWKYYMLNGKVVCSFKCYKVEEIEYRHGHFYLTEQEIKDGEYRGDAAFKSCLAQDELHSYLQGKNGYAIHISDLKIFDKPKELSEFQKYCMQMINDFIAPIGLKYDKNTFQNYKNHSGLTLTKAPQNFVYVEMPTDN